MGKQGKPQKKRRATRIKPYVEPDFTYMFKAPDAANKPPKPGLDEQQIPKNLQKLMKQVQDVKNGVKPKPKPEYTKNIYEDKMLRRTEPGMTRPLDPIPDFTRQQYETDNQYRWRIRRQTNEVIAKSKIEAKYDIKIQNDEETGAPVIKYSDPVEPSKKKAKAKLRAKEKKAKKKEKANMKKEDKLTGFEDLQDKVKFGDRVDAPPVFTAKPRRAPVTSSTGSQVKAGLKSLKLKELLAENSRPHESNSTRKPGQSVKKKDLSIARQQVMNTERQRAVDLYRKIKHRKANTTL